MAATTTKTDRFGRGGRYLNGVTSHGRLLEILPNSFQKLEYPPNSASFTDR